MPDHNYHDEELVNRETRHEQSDVPVRPLLWTIVIFIVFGFLTHIVITFFYKGLAKAERGRMDPPQTEIARPANADVPQNQPLLQPFPRKERGDEPIKPQTDTPVTDLQKMRAAEKQVLTSYGWVDRQQGAVRIPIDEAKKLLAARLAVQAQTGAAAAAPAASATTTAPAAPATTTAVQPTSTNPPMQPASGNDGVRP
jgi:hypothetical protein